MAMEETMTSPRAELYYWLAEALAPPPDWLAGAGADWPILEPATQLAAQSETAQRALASLAAIPPESPGARRARYQALFAGPGRPRFWLYESMQRSGRLLGPETAALERLYRAAGLTPGPGAELPDHAALELSFLGFLAERQDQDLPRARTWRRLERRFIAHHAGTWLPQLGRALAATGDPVYGPLGALLAGWLDEASGRSRPAREARSVKRPAMVAAGACTLCGFCAQVCPTRALRIQEDATTTSLYLAPGACTGCSQCGRVCDTRALLMTAISTEPPSDLIRLAGSPRAICPGCGQATVSEAEMGYLARQLGSPAWLPYCLACRPGLLEH